MKRTAIEAISSSQILRYYRIPILIVFIGTLLCIAAYVSVIMYDVRSLQKNFIYVADIRVQALQKELDSMVASLELGGNSMQSQVLLEPHEFQSIADVMLKQSVFDSVLWIDMFDGVPAIRYQAGTVAAATVADVVQKLRESPVSGTAYYPTTPLAPQTGEEMSRQLAVLIPVRKGPLVGHYAVGILNTSTLFSKRTDWSASAGRERVYLYDGADGYRPLYAMDESARLFTRMMGETDPVLSYDALKLRLGFHVERTVYLGDIYWQIVIIPTGHYMAGVWRGMALIILVSGLIIVGLLGFERFQAATSGMRTAIEVDRKTLALSESETRLRTVIEQAVDGLLMIDSAGTIESFNPACENMFGYRADEVIGKNISVLMPQLYPKEQSGQNQNFQETAIPLIIGVGREMSAQRKNGTLFPIELGVSEIVLGGRVLYSGILRDITARLEAQQANALLAAIVESSDDAIISKTPEGIITSWNTGATRLLGYKAEEVVGKHISVIVPNDRKEEEGFIIDQIRRGRSVQHYETLRLTKDGRTVAISLTVSPICDAAGKVVGASKVARDITDRRNAERKLRDAHKFLEDVMNHIPDPLFMKDRQHRWIGGNKAFWSLMNGPPEKFLGKSDYEFFPKEEADAFWERDDLVFTSGEALTNEEFFTDQSGQRHVFSTKKMAFLNERGEQFLVGVIRDITERINAEAEREKLISQLTVSNTELERFAYICSHDLQEPLRMIANYTQRLSQHCEGKLDDKALHYMKYVVEGANNARMLISDVLTFARIGSETEKPNTTDAAQVLAMVLHTLEESIRQGGVRVEYDKLPRVLAHRTHVVQLLQNLISNAVKFRKAEGAQVTVSAEREGEFWRFCVRDNGIGVAPEYRDKIFEIFQRLHKRSEYPGTGIGLAVCQKIVQQYGGKIFLESEPGEGSAFFFTLPAA